MGFCVILVMVVQIVLDLSFSFIDCRVVMRDEMTSVMK